MGLFNRPKKQIEIDEAPRSQYQPPMRINKEKMKDFMFEICVVSWHPYPECLRMNNAYMIIPD